ncbi:acyl-CoA N-acyltransferase [Xylariaceae sp. FL0016]|nr:acyl-CoA N-acyltransferase [Xylariaceae sp. FL0016]
MTDKQQVQAEPATLEDVPALVATWASAFGQLSMENLFPSEEYRARIWGKWISPTPENEPECRVRVVKDEKGQVVAAAAYHIGRPGQDMAGESYRTRYPACSEFAEMNDELLHSFFTTMAISHKYAMEDKPHIFLECLICHEDHHGKGYGGALLQWGSDLAEELGYDLYLDASTKAIPLYERHGYVKQNVDAAFAAIGGKRPETVSTPMIRAKEV